MTHRLVALMDIKGIFKFFQRYLVEFGDKPFGLLNRSRLIVGNQ
jgi:hypothetical protein